MPIRQSGASPRSEKKAPDQGRNGQGPKRQAPSPIWLLFFIHPTAVRWIARAYAQYRGWEVIFFSNEDQLV